MPLKSVNPTTTKAWSKLQAHYEQIKNVHMRDLFAKNPSRASLFSSETDGFMVDFSKNRIDETTLELLLELANEMDLKNAINSQFNGETINQTEQRAVLHTALRNPETDLFLGKTDIGRTVRRDLRKIKNFAKEINKGKWKGFSEEKITDIVNIGIGGSDLGPKMAVEALKYYNKGINVHFVSNADGDQIAETLKNLRRETTLFIIVSKTFTTQETITNAETAQQWFLDGATILDIERHFVAVTNNKKEASKFGIQEANVFSMNDWVGGRFSLWSSVGLSIACSVGYDNFKELLDGARAMDVHFQNTTFDKNIPIMLALISVWYNNFFNTETEAIISYSNYLNQLIPYLQQGVMESNGKNVDRNGEPVNYQTGTIIWGEIGSNAQHTFFQLLHQGTKLIPTDFIGFVHSLHGNQKHHDILMANFFAQTEALLLGKSAEALQTEGVNEAMIPFKVHEGNQPTNTILMDKLTPKNLGMLIAMYEQKLFVQGVIWNIFSYDQMGVELGKVLSKKVLYEIDNKQVAQHDSSTTNLLEYYLKRR